MNVGDKVQISLYDKDSIGSILKIHRKEGWKGYLYVLLDNKQKMVLPVSFIKVINENR